MEQLRRNGCDDSMIYKIFQFGLVILCGTVFLWLLLLIFGMAQEVHNGMF